MGRKRKREEDEGDEFEVEETSTTSRAGLVEENPRQTKLLKRNNNNVSGDDGKGRRHKASVVDPTLARQAKKKKVGEQRVQPSTTPPPLSSPATTTRATTMTTTTTKGSTNNIVKGGHTGNHIDDYHGGSRHNETMTMMIMEDEEQRKKKKKEKEITKNTQKTTVTTTTSTLTSSDTTKRFAARAHPQVFQSFVANRKPAFGVSTSPAAAARVALPPAANPIHSAPPSKAREGRGSLSPPLHDPFAKKSSGLSLLDRYTQSLKPIGPSSLVGGGSGHGAPTASRSSSSNSKGGGGGGGSGSNSGASGGAALKRTLAGATFRLLNEQLYTTRGDEAFRMFSEDNSLFFQYHEGFREQVDKWPSNPLDIIIEWLAAKPTSWVVGDFGCGEARLAQTLSRLPCSHLSSSSPSSSSAAAGPAAGPASSSGKKENQKRKPVSPATGTTTMTPSSSPLPLDAIYGTLDSGSSVPLPRKIHSFDLVRANDFITPCDITHVPIESESLDVAVYCLALMGTNLTEFLIEASRTLKVGGILKIAEVSSRFIGGFGEFVSNLEVLGFKRVEVDDSNDFFVIMEFIKERGLPVLKHGRSFPVITLKPCIYKRR